MTYAEAIEYLYNATPQFQQIGAAAYKPGLDTTIALDNAFGNCHRAYKTIHVGGTNGKGSTSHTIASILQEQGFRVGLYTSPHLIDFRERIRVNGEMISETAVIDFLERYKAMNLDFSPSFFELTTIMAFEYFKKQNVDYAVIEVGLGGRLDCTNIISPILSVITNISKDHVAQLGNTLESIAKEKAGIIKHGVPVVIGEAEGIIREIFENKAAEVGTQISFAEDDLHIISEIMDFGSFIEYKTEFGIIKSPLSGSCQRKNMRTILCAINTLINNGLKINNKSILDGCEKVVTNTHLMGRWMTVSHNPKIITDTGHNIGGWRYLSKQLAEISDKCKLWIVLGFVSDKDVDSILALLPKNANYLFTRASVPRAMPSEMLKAKAETYGISGESFGSVNDAVEVAKSRASNEDVIFVGGSTFVVADLLSMLNS
ncbi:MAG: bifunctional folylpolyglutamate synthase/dihydrofolate synthase [Muribaculaceae bacterium]